MRTVSYSQLRQYARCPWRWGLERIEGWRVPAGRESEGLRIGSHMHVALAAAYWHGAPVKWPRPSETLTEEEAQELGRLTEMMEAEVEADLKGLEVLGTEWPFRVSLPAPSGQRSNYRLIGWIDLIAINRASGAVEVWDHKTTKRWGPKSKPDYQLGLYAWALGQLGLAPDAVVLNVIKRTKSPERVKVRMGADEVGERFVGREVYKMAKQLPPLTVKTRDLAKNVTSQCSWDCDFCEVCELDRMGHGAAARIILESQFEQSGHTGGHTSLDNYHRQVPGAWVDRAVAMALGLGLSNWGA